MIKVTDDFLDKNIFSELQDYTEKTEFNVVTAGDKQFSTLEVPKHIYPLIEMDGYDITLAFIRRAYNGFDEEMRVHCDGIIMNKKTDYASVLYINKAEGVTSNGTAFYEHKVHGPKLDKEDEAEFNRLILEDSNDSSKWKLTDFISSKPNRLLTYKASLFHSKFPNKISEGVRVVLVVFYSKSN